MNDDYAVALVEQLTRVADALEAQNKVSQLILAIVRARAQLEGEKAGMDYEAMKRSDPVGSYQATCQAMKRVVERFDEALR